MNPNTQEEDWERSAWAAELEAALGTNTSTRQLLQDDPASSIRSTLRADRSRMKIWHHIVGQISVAQAVMAMLAAKKAAEAEWLRKRGQSLSANNKARSQAAKDAAHKRANEKRKRLTYRLGEGMS